MKLWPVYTFPKTIWVVLEEWFGSKTTINFGNFLFRLLFWRSCLRGSLLEGSSSVCVRTKFIPVVSIVANEVCNLTEGLVCDWAFERRGVGRHGIS
jgi:hypothetical protein